MTQRKDLGTIVVEIEAVEQTYYISEDTEHSSSIGDEALIKVNSRIIRASPPHARFLDQSLELTLGCARSFDQKGACEGYGNPAMLFMNLHKNHRSWMAYLPGDAFWAIPRMIEVGSVTNVELRFKPLHYGSAPLLSIYFCSGLP